MIPSLWFTEFNQTATDSQLSSRLENEVTSKTIPVKTIHFWKRKRMRSKKMEVLFLRKENVPEKLECIPKCNDQEHMPKKVEYILHRSILERIPIFVERFLDRCYHLESHLFPGEWILHRTLSDLVGSDHPTESDWIPGDGSTVGPTVSVPREKGIFLFMSE